MNCSLILIVRVCFVAVVVLFYFYFFFAVVKVVSSDKLPATNGNRNSCTGVLADNTPASLSKPNVL